MKYKIGDEVFIKAKIESIEITKDTIFYNLTCYNKKARFPEELLAPNNENSWIYAVT